MRSTRSRCDRPPCSVGLIVRRTCLLEASCSKAFLIPSPSRASKRISTTSATSSARRSRPTSSSAVSARTDTQILPLFISKPFQFQYETQGRDQACDNADRRGRYDQCFSALLHGNRSQCPGDSKRGKIIDQFHPHQHPESRGDKYRNGT